MPMQPNHFSPWDVMTERFRDIGQHKENPVAIWNSALEPKKKISDHEPLDFDADNYLTSVLLSCVSGVLYASTLTR